MRYRATSLSNWQVAGFVACLGFATVMGCWEVCHFGPVESFEIDLGVDVDLHAVAAISASVGERYLEALAVGQNGTVVVWGSNDTGRKHFVSVSEISHEDLRAVWADGWSWWVAGDAATLMVSYNRGTSWDTVDLQTNATLRAIDSFAGRPLVVGDEVVAVRTVDGTWTVIPPPPDGWGQLRDVYVDDAIHIVGLDGVIWYSSDPLGEWIAEDSGVSSDLLAIGEGLSTSAQLVAFGAAGTMIGRDANGWHSISSGVTVDLVDYTRAPPYRVLGANGEIYQSPETEGLTLVDTFPGAEALASGLAGGRLLAVGKSGTAMGPLPDPCH